MSLSTKHAAGQKSRPALPPTVFPVGFAANEEPPLSEVLADPIVRCIMASDGVRGDRLAATLASVRSRLLHG